MKRKRDESEKIMRMVGWILLPMGISFLAVAVTAAVLLFVVFARDIPPGSDERIAGWVLMIVFGVLGAGLAVGGAALFSKAKKHRRRVETLMQEGVQVMAEVLECLPDYGLVINRRPTYMLRCTWKSPYGQAYIFTRRYLRNDPQTMLAENRVRVYYDRDDMKNYYVDVEASYDARIIEL